MVFDPFVNDKFPPYNVRKDDNDYFVEVALAGYDPKDIDVEVKDNTLSISSDKVDLNGEFLYKKIANRKFNLKIELAQHMEVKEVTSENGILTVHVHKEVPPELLPKRYEAKRLSNILEDTS